MSEKAKAKAIIKDNGAVLSTKYNDIYFMVSDSVAESKHVYIHNSQVSSKFCSSNIKVLENGFGTGLNFFLTLEEWFKKGCLHGFKYIGIEKYPLDISLLKKVYANLKYEFCYIPKFKDFFNFFCSWFDKIEQGENDLIYKNIRLKIIYDDCNKAMDYINEKVDVIYLDGFSPNKNPKMWEQNLFKKIYKISKYGTTLVTFSSASNVRKNLILAGFDVEKVTGFGKKRESLKCLAIKTPNINGKKFRKVKVIGGGITGCSVAYYLNKEGYDVTIYDKNNDLMSGTSGNKLAIINGRFGTFDIYVNKFNELSFFHSLKLYNDELKGENIWAYKGIVKKFTNIEEKNRYYDLSKLKKFEKHIHYKTKNKENYAYLPTSGAVFPEKIKKIITKDIKFIKQKIDINKIIEEKEKDELIILATSHYDKDIFNINEYSYITRGQTAEIFYNNCEDLPNKMEVNDGFLVPLNKSSFIGATLKHSEMEGILDDEKQEIFSKLNINGNGIKNTKWWSGLRLHSKTKIPTLTMLKDGVFLINSMGSRGFINAPFCAYLLTRIISGKNIDVDLDVLKMLKLHKFDSN